MVCKNLLYFKLFFLASMMSLIKASNPSSSTYTAGVVESDGVWEGTPESMLNRNMHGYQYILKKYAKKNNDLDIIVFPEGTLNNEETPVFIPDNKNNTIPCEKTNPKQDLISKLSCLASDYKKYIVFNIVEKENCTAESQKQKNDDRTCATNGINLYNTNVVFDRNGRLISRYRKWNLYDLDIVNVTRKPEYIIFKTDFGVDFVSIVCFDVLWWTPTMELVKKGYKNFVHPIWWFSELPFLTANQVHQGWAYAANVNLLTAGGNFAGEGATGSAVYNGRRGPIVAKMTATPTKQILIAKVPKSNTQKPEHTVADDQMIPKFAAIPQRLLGLTLDRDVTVDSYANVLLKPKRVVKERVCHGNFCCKFKIKRKPFSGMANKNHYSYRLVAYSGPRKFNNSAKIKWMQACAIIACTDDKSIKSCAKIFDDNVPYWNTHYFQSIKIKTNLRKQEKMIVMPNSVDAMMKPIPVNGFTLKTRDKGGKTKAVIKLTKPVSDLLTFGIFADYYEGFTSV